MPTTAELYQLADELRANAALGLQYSQNEYDTMRYKQILAASARLVASIENVEENIEESIENKARLTDKVLAQFENNLQQVSPRLAADAVVFRHDKILLIQRSDNGLWCLPGGSVDVGESLSDAAKRELWEETGLQGRVVQLLAILDSRHPHWRSLTKVQIYNVMFLVEIEDACEPTTTLEAMAVGFFGEDELPPLFSSHRTRVPLVFKQRRGEANVPYVD